jgi:putative peptidoglycan lipid II flippase
MAAIDEFSPAGADTRSTLAAAGRSAVILTGGMIASQVFVVVREVFVAAQVGASSSLDALLVGIVLPITLGGVLTAGTSVALVPAYLSARADRGPLAARRFAGYVLFWVAAVSLLVWLLLEVGASQVVAITGSGLSPESKLEAVGYLRLTAPVVFVFGIYGILAGVCQAEERFGSLAAATIGIAAASVGITLMVWDRFGMTAYAIGSLAGPIAGLIIVVIELHRRSVLPRPVIRSPGPGLRSYVGQALPLVISSSILQLNAVADTAVASRLHEGSVASLRLGTLIVAVPIGAISVAWGKAIYPQLVKTTLGSEAQRLGALTNSAIRFALAVFVPIAMLTVAVAPLAVSVAYGRGEFDTDDIEQTALVVAGYAPLIAMGMVTPPLVGALNARRKAWVLLAGGIINVTCNVTLDIVLGLTVGIIGIALATTITSVVIATFFSWRVRRLEQSFDVRALLRVVGQAVLAAIPGTLLVAWIAWTGWMGLDTVQGLIALGVLGTGGMATYFILARAGHLREQTVILHAAVRYGARRLGR